MYNLNRLTLCYTKGDIINGQDFRHVPAYARWFGNNFRNICYNVNISLAVRDAGSFRQAFTV